MRFLCVAVLPLLTVEQNPDYNKKLEDDLMKDYNSRHRPVKKEATTVQVSVYMSISHVEKVDEYEQTMLVHGHLWATWFDEYLVWDAAKYNNTMKLSIDSWRIWQPALALYNSARGNSWHLYMHGLPAMVANNGRVWASGSFSFHVTCRFEFSNWPYDDQVRYNFLYSQTTTFYQEV
uniref:Neur_chan_LBD domain-containing protein n=1 Tax=Heterorhabditis bacteriophora TaxID=37862 RepID=A0A1I7XUJ4_HETBA